MYVCVICEPRWWSGPVWSGPKCACVRVLDLLLSGGGSRSVADRSFAASTTNSTCHSFCAPPALPLIRRRATHDAAHPCPATTAAVKHRSANSKNSSDVKRHRGGLKTRDWKTQHQTAGLVNTGKGMYGKPEFVTLNSTRLCLAIVVPLLAKT